MKRIDLTGKTFGRLTVIKYDYTTPKGEAHWLCKCECGKKKTIMGKSLRVGQTQSCGCYQKEICSGQNNYQAKKAIEKHGIYFSSEDPYYIQAMCIMQRAKKVKIPVGFNSIIEFANYIKEITPAKCPVFNRKLVRGKGQSHSWSPSVDKIIPKKGYVKGNIQVVSYLANSMKRDASPSQLKQFAQWVMKGESNV